MGTMQHNCAPTAYLPSRITSLAKFRFSCPSNTALHVGTLFAVYSIPFTLKLVDPDKHRVGLLFDEFDVFKDLFVFRQESRTGQMSTQTKCSPTEIPERMT